MTTCGLMVTAVSGPVSAQPHGGAGQPEAVVLPPKMPGEDANAHPAPPNKAMTATTVSAGELTAESMATKPKPKGFRYAVRRNAIVVELSDTILYVLPKKKAPHTVAIPVPKDRKLLDECLAGGTVDNLVKGAVITAKYDPRGVVRPEIIFVTKSEIEQLDNAKVLDRGGNKLYVILADGTKRGFQIEGGAKGWEDVVQNGPARGLAPGALIDITFDPSGREPLKITLVEPDKVAKEKPKGCGCDSHGPRSSTVGFGPAGILMLLVGGLLAWRRRENAADSGDHPG